MSSASRQVWNWRDETPTDARRRHAVRLRRRGLVAGAVALILGTILNKVLGHVLMGRVLVVLGALQIMTALWRPLLLDRPARWLARFGAVVGTGLSWLLLTPLWLAVFVPAGWWLRLRGQDPLQRAPLAAGLTAWIPRRHATDAASLARQFLDEDDEARELDRPDGTLPAPEILAEIEPAGERPA